MRFLINIFALMLVVLSTTSCWMDKKKPNVRYMPNMYDAVAYEPYSQMNLNKDSIEALLPVKGTIPRGYVPYELENTNKDYAKSKSNTSPSDFKYDEVKGKEMFRIYCSSCHGVDGDGQGTLVLNKKYSGVPNYKEREITVGSIYHVIMYGKGPMGSHASQLTVDERWQIANYVMELKNK